MAFLNTFEGKYVFGWAIDDYKTFYKAIDEEMDGGKDMFNKQLEGYKKVSYSDIKLLLSLIDSKFLIYLSMNLLY